VSTGGGILAEQLGSATFQLERGSQSLATPAATVLALNNVAPETPTAVNGTVTVVENGSCLLPSAP
jgi:hypothetical protein